MIVRDEEDDLAALSPKIILLFWKSFFHQLKKDFKKPVSFF